MHPEIIYEIPYSKSEPPFQLKYSANAWWMNPVKVGRLIAHLELGRSLPRACEYADITHRQYRYFLKIHPEFNLVRNHLTHRYDLEVREILLRKMEDNPRLAFKHLERTDPDYYSKRYIGLPYCMECKKRININDVPPIFRKDFDEMAKPTPTPVLEKELRDKFKVKPEKPKKIETPEEREARLAEARAKKKINDGLKEQQRKYDAYKKRHPEVSPMHFWPPIREKD